MKRAKELKRGLIVDDEHVISFFYCLVRADSEKCDKHETNWAKNLWQVWHSAQSDYLALTKHSFFWAKESSRFIDNNELHIGWTEFDKKNVQGEEKKHGEEINFLKRTNQQLKAQLEGIISQKK